MSKKIALLLVCFVLFLPSIISSANSSTGIVTATLLNFRTAPNTNGEVISQLSKGTEVTVLEHVNNTWVKITHKDKTGYVASQYLSIREGTVSRSAVDRPEITKGVQIVQYAEQFLGVKYILGANGPKNFDCSGFVQYVYSHFGIKLSRTSFTQVKDGTYVEKSNLRPGDVVCFSVPNQGVNHVGIYVGNNKFIHASSAKGYVKYNSLDDAYYKAHYYSARRMVD